MAWRSIVKSQRLVIREVFLTFLKYFEIIVPNHDYKHLFSIYLIGHSYFSAHLNTNSAFQKDIFLLQFSLLRFSELTTLKVIKNIGLPVAEIQPQKVAKITPCRKSCCTVLGRDGSYNLQQRSRSTYQDHIWNKKKPYVFKGILCLYFHFFPEKKSMLILMPFPYEILLKNSSKKLNIYDTLEDNV